MNHLDQRNPPAMKTLTIEQDIDPESPRSWDNLGTMACAHGRYNLGDKEADLTPITKHCDSWKEVKRRLITEEGAKVILPLYLYDHGDLTISTQPFSCPWDSGQVGFIYITKAKLHQEFPSWKRITKQRREKLEKYLRAEVEVYDQYLTGQVFGFIIKDEGKETDSCWGFFGEDVDGIAEHAGVPPAIVHQAFDNIGEGIPFQ